MTNQPLPGINADTPKSLRVSLFYYEQTDWSVWGDPANIFKDPKKFFGAIYHC